jgi:hypothetical protein
MSHLNQISVIFTSHLKPKLALLARSAPLHHLRPSMVHAIIHHHTSYSTETFEASA